MFCPITIRAHILLRSLHRRDATWKRLLNESEIKEWEEIYTDLKNIPTIRINRCIHPQQSSDVHAQLHLFCDASQFAYAATVYVRIEDGKSASINLVFAKARIAPVNQNNNNTIPRLELLAVTLGSKILQTVRNSLNLIETSPAILWTDSRCVLFWLRSQKSSSIFITNRIRTIRTLEQLEF